MTTLESALVLKRAAHAAVLSVCHLLISVVRQLISRKSVRFVNHMTTPSKAALIGQVSLRLSIGLQPDLVAASFRTVFPFILTPILISFESQ